MSQEEVTIEVTTSEVVLDPIVTETVTVEIKQAGPQGIQGPIGGTIHTGPADPLNDVGVNGDYYMNTTTGDWFGPKAFDIWPASDSNLRGPAGQTGSVIHSDIVDPTDEGIDGDYFLNTLTADWFGPKAAGVWPASTLNLKGPKGDPGTGLNVPVEYIDLITGLPDPTRSEGRLFYDDERKCIGLYIDETEFTWQIGRELPMRVYNNTAGTLINGRAARVVGVGTGGGTYTLPYIDYATADFTNGVARNTIGIITHDIEPGSFGEVTILGWVNDVDSSAPLAAGAVAWLAASNPPDGTMTAVRPDSPNYAMEMGGCLVSDPVNGVLWCDYLPRGNKHDVDKFFNGAILEHHSVDVAESGGNIVLTLDNSGGSSLSMFFDAEFYEISVPATINLTPGPTDDDPRLNFVYIPESTKVLTVSTVGFPTVGQYVPVATVLCQTAASVAIDQVYKLHAWTDHLSSGQDQGHLADINKWIRTQNATWLDGVANAYAGSGTGTVTISTSTIGKVLQLHEHAFPIFPDPAPFFVINDPVTPYRKTTNLASILTDTEGNTLVANPNRFFSLVLWGAVSEHDDQCKLFVNLPGGSYTSFTLAAADSQKYANYSIPREYLGTGFLIHRYVCTWNGAGTAFTIQDFAGDELRGTFPNSVAGGSSSSGDFDPSGTALAFMTAHTDGETDPFTPYDHSTFITAAEVAFANLLANGSITTTVTDIKMNGIQALGVLNLLARADHVHPTDTSREPANVNIQNHIASTTNPHGVDIEDVTPQTTKGDLIVREAGGSVRLPVGADTYMLVADAAELSGLKWVVPPAGGAGSDTTAIHKNAASEISTVTEKVTPVNDDIVIIEDSASGFVKKKVKMSNMLGGGGPGSDTTAVHTNTANEISSVTLKAAPVNDDIVLIEDSEAAFVKKKVALSTLLGGGSDSDAVHVNVANEISGITEKVAPVSGDHILIEDSAAGNVKKRVQVGNLPGGTGGTDDNAVHVNAANEISGILEEGTPDDADILIIEDASAGYIKKKVQISNLPPADQKKTTIVTKVDTHTFDATDAGKHVQLNNAAAKSLIIPLNSAVAYQTGTFISFEQLGVGQVTLVPTAGVTLSHVDGNTGSVAMLGKNAVGGILKTGGDNWTAFGALDFLGQPVTRLNEVNETVSGSAKSSFAIDYTPGIPVIVVHNGVTLASTDYTQTSGTAVVLDTAAAVGEHVHIFAFLALDFADIYTKTESDANYISSFNAKLEGYNETTSRHKSYSGDLDDIAVNSLYNVSNTVATNCPPDVTSGWGFVHTMMHQSNANYATQTYVGMNSDIGVHWTRSLSNTVWTDWVRQAHLDDTSNRNFLINGGMRISQRGTSWTNPGSIYFIDRWVTRSQANVGGTLQISHFSGDVDSYVKAQFTSATSLWYMEQNIEHMLHHLKYHDEVTHLTFQFRSKTIDNAEDYEVQLYGSTATNGTVAIDTVRTIISIPATNDEQIFSVVIPLDRSALNGLTLDDNSFVKVRLAQRAAPADGSFRATDFKLEIGKVATKFEPLSTAEELALCQRYYIGGTGLIETIGTYYAPSSCDTTIFFPQQMRELPTVTVFDTLGAEGKVTMYVAAAYTTGVTAAANRKTKASTTIRMPSGPTSTIQYSASVQFYLQLDAEL